MTAPPAPASGHGATADEDGAALVLTIAFVFLLGIVFVALAGFATNAFMNTSNFKYQRTLATDAETDVTASMQYLRSHFASTSLYNATAQPCPGLSVSIASSNPLSGQTNTVVLECIATLAPASAITRTVDLFACAPGTPAGTCPTSQALLLHAQVDFDDYAYPYNYVCGPSGNTTCGTGMTVSEWDLLYADK